MMGDIMVGNIPYNFSFEVNPNIRMDYPNLVYYVNGSIVSWERDGVVVGESSNYTRDEIESYVRSGSWIIIDKTIVFKKCIKNFKI